MSKCQGLPTGPCPLSVQDASVKCGIGDLMLCPACDTERRNLEKSQHEVNELLCFMQQKAKTMAFDHIVSICVSFYTSDEVRRACTVLQQFVKQRLPLHKGVDKEKKTLCDMLKICLDPLVKLPTFKAVCLNRLPPVDADHVDVAALLQEVSMLRNEVRAVTQLRAEIVNLQALVNSLLNKMSAADNKASDTQNRSDVVVADGQSVAETGTTTADIVANAVKSGLLVNQPRRKRPLVIGKKLDSKIKSVRTWRTVDVFLSRLDPDTTVDDIKNCSLEILRSDANFDPAEVTVNGEQLQSKYGSYASYHVSVTVDSSKFGAAIELLMNKELWPLGVLVRRFFHKKDG